MVCPIPQGDHNNAPAYAIGWVSPFAFRYQGKEATSCQYIDTTRKAIDCDAADSFYIMKLCSRLLVLYCRNCPTDDKFRYLIPILRKLGAAQNLGSTGIYKTTSNTKLLICKKNLFCKQSYFFCLSKHEHMLCILEFVLPKIIVQNYSSWNG